MRRDTHFTSHSVELDWTTEDGCGGDIRKVDIVVMVFDRPGPSNTVGIHVEGLGGPNMPIACARELAAKIAEACDRAEVAQPSEGGAA